MKILFVKLSSLGDILHALALLPSLVGHEVDWIVEERCSWILKDHPQIRHLFTPDVKGWCKRWYHPDSWRSFLKLKKEVQKERYDWVIDLQGNCKSALFVALVKGKKVGFGFKNAAEWPSVLFLDERITLNSRQNVRRDLAALLGPLKIEFQTTEPRQISQTPLKRILVAPCTQWQNKTFSIEQWKKWLVALENKHELVEWVFTCVGLKEMAYVRAIAATLNTPVRIVDSPSLQTLKELLRDQDLVIAVDSFMLHFAALYGIATYGVFGPSLGAKYAPLGHPFFQGACPYGITFKSRCPRLRTCPTGACLKNVSPILNRLHVEKGA